MRNLRNEVRRALQEGLLESHEHEILKEFSKSMIATFKKHPMFKKWGHALDGTIDYEVMKNNHINRYSNGTFRIHVDMRFSVHLYSFEKSIPPEKFKALTTIYTKPKIFVSSYSLIDDNRTIRESSLNISLIDEAGKSISEYNIFNEVNYINKKQIGTFIPEFAKTIVKFGNNIVNYKIDLNDFNRDEEIKRLLARFVGSMKPIDKKILNNRTTHTGIGRHSTSRAITKYIEVWDVAPIQKITGNMSGENASEILRLALIDKRIIGRYDPYTYNKNDNTLTIETEYSEIRD